MSKKVYEELHEQYLSEIMKIKECRKRRNELSAQMSKMSSDDPDFDYFSLYSEFGDMYCEEERLEDILFRAVDDAYLNQPFNAVRQAGRTAFWKLVDETLDK